MESYMPTEEFLGYKSTVGIYGGKLTEDKKGKLVYNTKGLVSIFDRFGDGILRRYDEKNFIEMSEKYLSRCFHFFIPKSKRYRGNTNEITKNIERIGLENIYGADRQGIEIKKPNIFKKGYFLQDIYRLSELKNVDRFRLLSSASFYIKNIHNNRGAIGELLPSDIIFQKKINNEVYGPILNIPDIVFNNAEKMGVEYKKMVDLFDFTISIGIEELRRSKSWSKVEKAIEIILKNYDDLKIIFLLKFFIQNNGLILTQHNKVRFRIKESEVDNLCKIIILVCGKYKRYIKPNDDLISEGKLLKSIKDARQDYKKGKLKILKSLKNLI